MATSKIISNRREAAKKLAQKLQGYRNTNALVLGIPKGGAEIAYHLALALHLEFSVIIARRILDPDHDDHGIGAVCEEGTVYMNEAHRELQNGLEAEVLKLRNEILRQVLLYREGQPLPEISGRVVILADDVLITGASMAAAFLLCVRQGAAKVVIAAAMAPPDIAGDLREADELLILRRLADETAARQALLQLENLTDEQVLSLMRRYNNKITPSRD